MILFLIVLDYMFLHCLFISCLSFTEFLHVRLFNTDKFLMHLLKYFKKAKCKFLHLGWSDPKNKCRLGRE